MWFIYSQSATVNSAPGTVLLVPMLCRFQPLNIFFPLLQSISPGLVRTEFRGRANNVKDLEQSKKDYDKLCAEVHYMQVKLLHQQ